MPINYGSIDRSQRKPRAKSVIDHSAGEDQDRGTPEALEGRLLNLAYQNRAPSVAKAAAAELLERKSPRVKNPEQSLSPDEVRKICDIYDRLFREEP
jgi:hypothetical protein